MYYTVDIVDGLMDIDYETLIIGFSINGGDTAAVKLKPCTKRQKWKVISESEFLALKAINDAQ